MIHTAVAYTHEKGATVAQAVAQFERRQGYKPVAIWVNPDEPNVDTVPDVPIIRDWSAARGLLYLEV